MTEIVLTGARWSSATRCIAKAIHEHIGTPADEDAQFFLRGGFARGRILEDAWMIGQQVLADAAGKTLLRQAPVAWGLPEYGWEGHPDGILVEDELVIEVYNTPGGVYLEHKALQATQYALKRGYPNAVLVALDVNDSDEELGTPIYKHRVPVKQLAPSVRRIEKAVIAGARRGSVTAADRVGETPNHSECISCPFRASCWADWSPPPIDELIGAEVLFDMARVLDGDRQAQAKTLQDTTRRLEEVKQQLRDHLPVGEARAAGGIRITRKLSAPGVSFKFGEYRKRRLPVTPRMRQFVNPTKPTETWIIEPDTPEGDAT